MSFKHYIFVSLVLVLSFGAKAQNLVPNHSFENPYCTMTNLPTDWDIYNSPDFWSECVATGTCFPNNFCRKAEDGEQFIGMAVYGFNNNLPSQYYREYEYCKLIDSLKAGTAYCVKAYVSLAEFTNIAIDNFGFAITQTTLAIGPAFSPTGFINHVPEVQSPTGQFLYDRQGWTEIGGTYTATGGETWLYLGNFKNDPNTDTMIVGPPQGGLYNSYMLVDNVSIEKITKVKAGRDTMICRGESVVLGNNLPVEASSYTWSPATTLNCPGCTNPTANPSVTTTYVVKKTQCSYTGYDTVTVTVINCSPVIPNVFTPNGDGKNDSWSIDFSGSSNVNCVIYNRWGDIIYKPQLDNLHYMSWDGRSTGGETCNDGVYFYVLQYTNYKGQPVNQNGYVSLFR